MSETKPEATRGVMGTRNGERHRARVVAIVAGGVASVGWAWLARRSIVVVELWQLFAVLGLGWVALAVAVQARAGMRTVVVFAVLFRLAGVFASPVLEDDWARYLWDGWVFAERGSPYGVAPDQLSVDGIPAMAEVQPHINHPSLPTLYGPVAEVGFLCAYRVAPGKLWPLRLLLIAADLATLFLVARIGGSRAAAIYGWCPLVVQEIAFNVHVDAIGMALLFAAWAAIEGRQKRPFVGGALAGAATAVKVLAAPGVALLLAAGGVRGTQASWKVRVAFGVTLALFYLPFVWALGGDAGRFSLGVFMRTWRFNPLLFAPIAAVLGDGAARVVGPVVVALGIAALAVMARERAGARAIAAAFGVLLLFSPVVNPWYLLWAAPFIALDAGATGIAALLAVSLSYANGGNLAREGLLPFAVAGWARAAEAAILACGVAVDVVRARGQRRSRPFPPVA